MNFNSFQVTWTHEPTPALHIKEGLITQNKIGESVLSAGTKSSVSFCSGPWWTAMAHAFTDSSLHFRWIQCTSEVRGELNPSSKKIAAAAKQWESTLPFCLFHVSLECRNNRNRTNKKHHKSNEPSINVLSNRLYPEDLHKCRRCVSLKLEKCKKNTLVFQESHRMGQSWDTSIEIELDLQYCPIT